ncbi:glycosyltransferase [bacterium]|nr:glycosyltransferase [bacterium]
MSPCFRMKKYLKKFLEELPKQTMFNELEVVLDHNEPDPEEITWIHDFQKKYPGRLKHIIVPKVEWIGPSMNRCIRESSGEYLTIWNVDDLRTPDSIELQYKALQANKDAGIVYGDYIIVRSFGATTGKMIGGTFPDAELTRSMVIGPFFMFRKSLIAKAGFFDEHLRQAPDFDLAIRLAFHAKTIRSGGMLGYYLNEGLGMSTKPDSLQPIERVLIELRYGIYDKIDYEHVARASQYSVGNILVGKEWIPVGTYVPEYTKLLNDRRALWHKKGLLRFSLAYIFRVKPVVRFAKKHVKKMLSLAKPKR